MKNRGHKIHLGKRVMAALLAVVTVLTTVNFHVPAVHAEVPVFGDRTEDWDYNRIKQIGKDQVYALNHNEYQEYKSFSPVKFTGKNEIYLEFSYPYNCEADIQLYRIEDEDLAGQIQNGSKIPMDQYQEYLDELNENSGAYMGNLIGRPLKEHFDGVSSKGWTLPQIESYLSNLEFNRKDTEQELKQIVVYGYSGQSAVYNSLQSYYEYMGIERTQSLDEEQSEEKFPEKENVTGEEARKETVSETLELENLPEEESTEEDSMELSVMEDISVEDTTMEDVSKAIQQPEETKISVLEEAAENTSVSANEIPVVPEENPKESLSEEKEDVEEWSKESEEQNDAETVATVAADESDSLEEIKEQIEEEIPEDFYITEKNRFAQAEVFGIKKARAASMPTNIVHNYIVWDGTYLDKNGEFQDLANEESVYVIVIQPVDAKGNAKDTSLGKLRAYLPFAIGTPTLTGSNGEELQAFQREIYGDRMLYITLAIAMGGDPVDLVTGSLEWSYTDLTLEGEIPLSFTRSYSSVQAAAQGLLGNGWTHNYNYHLTSFYGTVSITLPNGTRMDFVQDYDGTYPQAPGSAYTLENSDGGWLLSRSDGTSVRFDATGLPIEMKDIHDNVTNLVNDGSHITGITTNSGTLTLSYSGDLLTAVSDQAGRTVTYTYSGTDLASATNPDGDTQTLAYDGSHNLTRVTGFTGEEMLSNTYNGEHQVVSQTLPDFGTYTYTYDKENRTTGHTAENGLTQTIVYDERNRIIRDTNNDGTITYTYDELNRRTSETDRKGNVTFYTYAGDTTNIETITCPDGTTETYAYNAKNQPVSKKQKDGTLLTFAYDGRGNLVSYTDAKGGAYTYEYDSNNYCTKQTDPLGNSTVYTYNPAGCPTTMTDGNGNTTAYTYDSVGRILTETTPEGNTTSYSYTPGGKLVTVTDPEGNRNTYNYTGNGFTTAETDALGNTVSYTYSAMNRMTGKTDRQGNTSLYTYDKNGERASVTDAEDNHSSYAYDHAGRKISSTDGNGNTTTYTYDANGSLTSAKTPESSQTTYTYDAMNRLTAKTDPEGGKETYTYDSMGRITAVTDGQGGVTSYAYDANGNLTAVTNARGCQTTYTYDSADRLTAVTDALGNTTTYTYDANGRCTQVIQKDATSTASAYNKDGELIRATDEAHGETAYTYDKLGRITEATDVLGNTIRYTYDANGNLLNVTDQNGSTTAYTYDKENRLTSITDAEGNKTLYTYFRNGWLSTVTDACGGVTAYTYDGAGNPTQLADPMGYTISYTYDRDGRAVTAADKNGNVTAFAYDGNDNLTTVTNPDGGVETYTYDHRNLLTAYTDGEGYTTAYGYDANGNLTTVTDARGNTTTLEYDALDRQTTATDALGGQVLLTYDSMGRITKAVNEDGAETEYTYDALGRVTRMQDALGNATSYTYDGAGNLLTVTDETGTTASYTYDKVGNVLTYTDGLDRTTTYEYDKNYNLIRVTDPVGAATAYEYDALGRVIKETDALGNSKTFTYDKNSRIIGVTDKNGSTTGYTLDGNGNLTCQTDPLGHKSYFEYDSMNRLVKITLYAGEQTGEDGGIIQTGEQTTLYTYDHRGLVTTRINAAGDGKYYVYDEAGNLISETDEDGYVTEHTYDALNRLSGTDYNGTKQVSYLYNQTGELVEMTDWNGTTTISRDLLNRISEVKDHNNRTTGYTWDAQNNLISITYPENMGTAVYTYDRAGNQLTATDPKGDTYTFTYDEADNLTSKLYPNGEMERYQYDGLRQLIRMDEYGLNGRQKTYTEYTYDAAGNRTSDCNRVPTTPTANYAYTGNKGTWGGEWNSYTYDALNRLVKEYENDTALTITYAYDSLGNKTYEKNSQDEKRYTYNEMNQLVTKEAYNRTTNYEYDKRGNRILETSIHTQENRRTFEWDETGRLVKGTRGPDYGLYTSEYTYNGLGIRINSTIMGPDKTIYDRDYVIDYTSPERNDLAEFNLGHYQWQGDKKVHDLTHLYNAAGQRLQTESTRYVDWAGEKHYTRYIHEDIMGSSYYYTNPENGYVTNKHEYTTWGNNTKAPTYNYDPEYRASEPYFTGHPYDGSLNLYYAENRFYDPETGSFLSSDPAKSGLNWYQYCGSNPTTYVDPLGLEAEKVYFNRVQGSSVNEMHQIRNSIFYIQSDKYNIQNDIDAGLFTMEDYKYLVALEKEAQEFYGFIAVAEEVTNRVRKNNSSIQKEAYKGAYTGFNENYTDNPEQAMLEVRIGAILVLRGEAPEIIPNDVIYHLARSGNNAVWYDLDAGGYCKVVGTNPVYKNVFYSYWEDKNQNKRSEAGERGVHNGGKVVDGEVLYNGEKVNGIVLYEPGKGWLYNGLVSE